MDNKQSISEMINFLAKKWCNCKINSKYYSYKLFLGFSKFEVAILNYSKYFYLTFSLNCNISALQIKDCPKK